jgi:hypothetical protein
VNDNEEIKVPESFYFLTIRCGRKHGMPLPDHDVIELGSDCRLGWHVLFNASDTERRSVPPFTALCWYNGEPAAFVDAAIARVNPDSPVTPDELCDWLQSDLN